MRNALLLSISFTLLIKVYSQDQVVTRISTTDLNLNIPSFRSMDSSGIASHLLWSISGTFQYQFGQVKHLISNPSDTFPNAPLHLIKKNNKWAQEGSYTNAKMNGARNHAMIDSKGTFAYVTSGTETEWNAGDVFICYTRGDSLEWKRLSKNKLVYEDVAVGDINQDSLFDVIAAGFTNPNLRPFLQTKEGLFIEELNYLKYKRSSSNNSGFDNTDNTGNAVAIDDLNKDGVPEIIRGQYTSSPEGRYGIAIHYLNQNSKIYDSTYFIPELGVFNDLKIGSTSLKTTDLNNDGYSDIIVATETITHGYNSIQTYLNDKNGKFKLNQTINYLHDTLQFREFLIFDFNKDGWNDIILNPFISIPSSSQLFRLKNNNGDNIWRRINPAILLNRNSKLDTANYNIDIKNIFPFFLKASIIDNKLEFSGFSFPSNNGDPLIKRDSNFNIIKDAKGNPIIIAPDSTRIIEIFLTFCKDLIRPSFNTNKYFFCSGDSLKLAVTNVNKGDTLKWYYGTRSDLTNVANKTFTDSTKLYVTRTDSIGCVVSSDTIQISKIVKPSSPAISRDSDNNLVANINGITWYKDGVKISDTTQKIKPISNGNYTATTTQNGCTSSASANYYYLTSAVANLSSDEYFKVSPNPTDGEIYLNYNIRSTRDVFISVIDMSGRTIISNRKVNSGNKLNLGTTMKGNYIIQVKDKTGRLLTTEKLIKN